MKSSIYDVPVKFHVKKSQKDFLEQVRAEKQVTQSEFLRDLINQAQEKYKSIQ